MEDPKRIRTKLRLDLQDVRKQIEDLEELLQQDSSAENVEAHRKLVEYEKKLKQEYEKISGLSVDQATRLEGKVKTEGSRKKSYISGFLGLIASASIFIGVYNTILHSIVGYDPAALIAYFQGIGGSEVMDVFTDNMTDGTYLYIVVLPLAGGGVVGFFASLFGRNRKGILKFFEGVGILILGVYLGGIVYLGEDAQGLRDWMLNYYGVMIGVIATSGFLMFIGGLGHKDGIGKFFSVGILGFYGVAVYQMIPLIQSENLAQDLTFMWPWIYIMIMGAMLFHGLNSLFRFVT